MKHSDGAHQPLFIEHELKSLLERYEAQLHRAFEANFGFKRDAVHFYSIKKAVHALLEASAEAVSMETVVRQLCEIPMRPDVLRTVVPHLTVYETYFFRHPEHFEWLRTSFFQKLETRKRAAGDFAVMCWSAGCSTGEEAYSLAIELSEHFKAQEGWKVKVLATDINLESLAIARKGCYGEWSFRDMPSTFRAKFFSPCDHDAEPVPGLPRMTRLRVHQAVRDLVSFSELNLHTPQWDTLNAEIQERSFDIIFCRNVLIYLQPDAAKSLVSRLAEKLSPHGVLVVGPSEPWLLKDTPLLPYSIPNGTVFFKQEHPDFRSPRPTQPAQSPQLAQLTGRALTTHMVTAHVLTAQSKSGGAHAHILSTAGQPPQKRIIQPALRSVRGAPGDTPINTQENSRESALQHAREFADAGEADRALELIAMLLREETTNAELYYLRGVAQIHKGDLAAAESDIKKSLFIEPDNIVAYVALASISKTRGNLREMKKHYSNALYYLSKIKETDIVPDSEGIPAKAMRDMIESLIAATE